MGNKYIINDIFLICLFNKSYHLSGYQYLHIKDDKGKVYLLFICWIPNSAPFFPYVKGRIGKLFSRDNAVFICVKYFEELAGIKHNLKKL